VAKISALLAGLVLSMNLMAQEPERRPQAAGFRATPGRAVCKDDTYKCMYNCTIAEGSICTPTRGSDPNCPNRKVSGGSWVTKQLVVIAFEGYHDMGCHVTARAKTNIQCGNTKNGWDCWVGRGMRER
jgi:hypothetical protein